jgi:hypothetical protein
MQALSDRTEPHSDSDVEDDNFEFEEGIRGSSDVFFDQFIKSKNAEANLIRLADDKVHLSAIISNYHIDFQERYSNSGWTHLAKCPLPNHDDRTPSFGYNPKEGIFNCYGCGRAGKTVKFIGYIENKSFVDVAKDLLSKFTDVDNLLLSIEEQLKDKNDELLLKFSKDVFELIKKSGLENLANIEKVTKVLDIYLARHLLGKIDSISLEKRLSLLLNKLEDLVCKVQ